jgi:hypothetical protein
MSVNYKGKPTHHLVAPNDEGHLSVNKKVFAASDKPEALIAALASVTLPKGWPVRLKSYTPASDGASAAVPVAPKAAVAGAAVPTKVPPVRPALADDSAAVLTTAAVTDSGDDEQPKWLHGRMSNEAAAALIPEGSEDGTFMLRTRDEGE